MSTKTKKPITEKFVKDCVKKFLIKAGFLDNGKQKELWERQAWLCQSQVRY